LAAFFEPVQEMVGDADSRVQVADLGLVVPEQGQPAVAADAVQAELDDLAGAPAGDDDGLPHSQGVDPGCLPGTTYTINDAQQITARNGSTTNWSYDKIGNETAGASTPEGTRTGEAWSDYSQLTSLTVAGKAYTGQCGSTDQSERIKLGDTFFHNGPLGLSAKSTAGVDMGFNREPGGNLNSMTTGGKSYYYLTDAIGSVVALADETGTKVNSYAYSPRSVERGTTTEKISQSYRFAGGFQDPTGLYHFSARYYDPNIGRFTTPTPPARRRTPTSTPKATPSTASTRAAHCPSVMLRMLSPRWVT
jgi:RHS repeat-associated protein